MTRSREPADPPEPSEPEVEATPIYHAVAAAIRGTPTGFSGEHISDTQVATRPD